LGDFIVRDVVAAVDQLRVARTRKAKVRDVALVVAVGEDRAGKTHRRVADVGVDDAGADFVRVVAREGGVDDPDDACTTYVSDRTSRKIASLPEKVLRTTLRVPPRLATPAPVVSEPSSGAEPFAIVMLRSVRRVLLNDEHPYLVVTAHHDLRRLAAEDGEPRCVGDDRQRSL
jgi:hypothetical protein